MPARLARESAAVPPEVQSRLEGAGLRRTLATRAVLGLFLTRPQQSLTHAQAQAALTARGLVLNRVTLYRLLDRLASCGVLRREADEQRVWRFSLKSNVDGQTENDRTAARFECDACHQRFDLPDAGEPARALKKGVSQAVARTGHQATRVELLVRGTCAACLPPRQRSRAAP